MTTKTSIPSNLWKAKKDSYMFVTSLAAVQFYENQIKVFFVIMTASSIKILTTRKLLPFSVPGMLSTSSN